MKKSILILMLCVFCAFLTVCACPAAGVSEEAAAEPPTVDLDLSQMSGTFVYAQVYNMMYEPENYLGKVIRIAGYYSAFEDQERGVVYHACVIPDATACCAQGLEFIWAGEHAWPDDYPELETDIIVTGRLESYLEDGIEFLHLVDADVLWNGETQAE